MKSWIAGLSSLDVKYVAMKPSPGGISKPLSSSVITRPPSPPPRKRLSDKSPILNGENVGAVTVDAVTVDAVDAVS